ncbi:MAG: hypothetical protein IJ298_01695 [Ruminococcus sp.]|nr:hypothetical protein [Ruminococcus sp.]
MLQDCTEIASSSVEAINGVTLNDNAPSHATNVTRLIVGTSSGFAKGAYVINSNATQSHIEALLDNGADIINMSFSSINYDTRYNYYARLCDHYVLYNNVVIIASACNNDPDYHRIFAPAISYNVIAVGTYHLGGDTYTSDISDDKMTEACGYDNVGYAEKPDIIVPGGSTSYASPILTSCISLMFQLKPSLNIYPQAVKAIVLASAHHKVLPARESDGTETMHDGITEHQGAGAFNLWSMISIVCQGTYGVRTMSSGTTQNSIRFVQPYYGAESMNVSLTWLVTTDTTGNDAYANDEILEISNNHNLDMYVYRNTSQIGVSNLANSSTEMVYVDLTSRSNYEIRVQRGTDVNNIDIKYGYAYSTDNSYITPITKEGIYRIKNYEDGRYMTLDISNNEIKLEDYSNSNSQYWIINQNFAYQISSAYEQTPGIINRGSSFGTGNKAILGTSYLNFSILEWEDNSIELGNYGFSEIYTYIGGNRFVLSYFDDYVTMSSMENSSEKKYWLLEKVNYKKGDVNIDGEFTEEDINLISSYLNDSVVFNNMQSFLADVDDNGVIDTSDATAIESLIDKLY